jgi:nucleoside permease NupC
MRVAFEKFMIQTKIDNKNKEFCNIILKLLNYSKTDIEFIYNSIQLKKKGKFI